MLKWLNARRKTLAGVALIVIALAILAPGAAVAAGEPEPNDDNFVTRMIIDLIDGVRFSFQKLGMQTVGEMVYNQKCEVEGWALSTRTVTCSPDTTRILGNTFTESEWGGVTKIAVGIGGLFGIMMVIGAMFAGIQFAESGADDRKRAAAMEKLKNMGLVALMTGIAGPVLYFIFETNDLFVSLMGNIGGAVDFSQLFSGSGMGQMGKIMVGLFSIVTEVSLNLTYVMRKFALMALIAITPLAMYAFIFESTKEVIRLWFQELISNLAIQTVHAILIALFFQAYPASSGGASAFGALCFLMILPPLTNMLRSIVTSGRASSFTGQGIAAAMTGVGLLTGAGKAIAGVGSVSLMGALSRAGAGSMIGAGALGGGAVGGGGIGASPEMMSQASQMAANMGGGGGGGGGGGPATRGSLTNAIMSKAGASDAAQTRAGAYGADRKEGIMSLAKAAKDGDVGARLEMVKRLSDGATKAVGAVGSVAGALGGAGLAMATGDASYIQAGATLGNRVGKLAGRVGAGATLGAGTAASMALSGDRKVGHAARMEAEAARSGGAGWAKSAVAGVKAGISAAGGNANDKLQALADRMGGDLAPHERLEAAKYSIYKTLGGTVGGRIGQSIGLRMADASATKLRERENLGQMGEGLDKYLEQTGGGFKKDDVIEYRGFPNRTDVYFGGQKVDIVPEGHPDATMDKPIYGGARYTEVREGQFEWRPIEAKDPTPKGEVGPNANDKVARPEPTPKPELLLGKGRGGYRRR